MESIALVASKGGHLGQIQMICTQEILGKKNVILITETADSVLEPKEELGMYKTYLFKKDSLGYNLRRYFVVFLKMRKLFVKEHVSLVISTGGHIALPAFLAAKMIGARTIFIDTVIRVKTPNWSARCSYLLSDIFLVQHESMRRKYGKRACYEGGIL